MRNILKKTFSLLLIGVVTVSMFSFTTPNRVDAVGTPFIVLKIEKDKRFTNIAHKKDGYVICKFFDRDGKCFDKDGGDINFKLGDNVQRIDLPSNTKKIEVEAFTPTITNPPNLKRFKATFTVLPYHNIWHLPNDKTFLEILISPTAVSMNHSSDHCIIKNYHAERIKVKKG